MDFYTLGGLICERWFIISYINAYKEKFITYPDIIDIDYASFLAQKHLNFESRDVCYGQFTLLNFGFHHFSVI